MTAAAAACAAGAERTQGTGTQRWLQRKCACGGSAGLHDRGTRAFHTALNEAGDWVADEIDSRRTGIAVANCMMDVLNRACP
jgi:hypothetical protein